MDLFSESEMSPILVPSRQLTQPIKWHGGKHYQAAKIVDICSRVKHTHFVETHFGGGSALLEKSPFGVSEVANDIHIKLTNFWRVLQDESKFKEFKRIIEAVPMSSVEFTDAGEYYRALHLSSGQRLLC